MKKLLMLLFFVGCEDPKDIIVQEIMEESSSGTYIGYSIDDCVSIELDCIETEGEYQFGEPDSDILCVCKW
tara:strand:- start:415 stop:627 length:213 start_codon:yes stop_codon:yes gene_type:complete